MRLDSVDAQAAQSTLEALHCMQQIGGAEVLTFPQLQTALHAAQRAAVVAPYASYLL
jgi:SpoU rRNA methylase family enzyme